MEFINNERYSTIVENLRIYNNQFICAYPPVYGLVKVKDFIMKVEKSIGVIFCEGDNQEIVVKYIREKVYTDGFHGEQLSIEEICNLLKD